MVARMALIMAGADERFPAQPQEFLEVDRARAELLFFCEWDILCDRKHLLLFMFELHIFALSVILWLMGYERRIVLMNVYSVDEIRSRVAPVAEKHGLKAVYLFGSYARGTATSESDIDLLVDISGTNIKSLLQLSEVLCDFEDALGKQVDLVTTRSLEQPIRMPSDVYFRENLRNERVELYAVA